MEINLQLCQQWSKKCSNLRNSNRDYGQPINNSQKLFDSQDNLTGKKKIDHSEYLGQSRLANSQFDYGVQLKNYREKTPSQKSLNNSFRRQGSDQSIRSIKSHLNDNSIISRIVHDDKSVLGSNNFFQGNEFLPNKEEYLKGVPLQLISYNSSTRTFDIKEDAQQAIALTAGKIAVVSVIGPPSCGKSTLLNSFISNNKSEVLLSSF